MGELRCVDGSILTVTAVACNDRLGVPYELTLDLSREGKPFASVGERCGFRLTQLAAGVPAGRGGPAPAGAGPGPGGSGRPVPPARTPRIAWPVRASGVPAGGSRVLLAPVERAVRPAGNRGVPVRAAGLGAVAGGASAGLVSNPPRGHLG